MEPLSALSIAGTLVQFLDFSSKLIGGAIDLYSSESTATPENNDFNIVTTNLAAITTQLTSSTPEHLSREETALHELASQCQVLSDDLQKLLGALRLRNSRSKRESVRVAWESMRKRKEVNSLQKRLDLYRSQITLQVAHMMRSEQSAISKKLDQLIQEGRSYGSLHVAFIEGLRVDIKDTCDSLKVSRSPSDSQAQFSKVTRQLLDLSRKEHESSYALRVLKALEFETRENRIKNVNEAHAKTFEWILEKSTIGVDGKIDNTFKEWLATQAGIYFISGKAGSGKSTLMKYICKHPNTHRTLNEWAGRKKLVFAHFFFWNAGTGMQKSLEGLLRSLLFEVLQQCPERIPDAFPENFRYSTRLSNTKKGEIKFNYTDVVEAFDRILSAGDTFERYRFCFFIDGLDEYAGDHRQIVNLLKKWATSPDIKICVSSRPWNIFEDTFPEAHKLKLQDLTRDDIEIYVSDSLGRDENFLRMLGQDASYGELVDGIVNRAEGVFLWVYLVTKSLLDGLGNDDRISDLERKLQSVPKGLVPFFRHMLDSVDPSYREVTARMFMVAQMSPKPLPALIYSFLDELEENPDFAMYARVGSMSRQEISRRTITTRRRLDGRCRGLLEVRADPVGDPIFSCQVDFLHRTVREFIELDDIQRELGIQVSYFDAEGSLAQACLALFKLVPIRNEYFTKCGPLYDLIDDVLFWARQKELKTGLPQLEVIQEVERAFREHRKRPFFAHTASTFPSEKNQKAPKDKLNWKENGEFSLIQFAATKGLLTYVSRKVEGRTWLQLMQDSRTQNLLDCAVLGGGYKTQYPRKPSLQLVWYLFELGASAAETSASRLGTIWENYAEMFYQIIYPNDPTSDDWRMIEVFLRYKADPDVLVRSKVETLRKNDELLELSPSSQESSFNFKPRVQGRWIEDLDDPYFREWRHIPLQEFVAVCSPKNADLLVSLIERNRVKGLGLWSIGGSISKFFYRRADTV